MRREIGLAKKIFGIETNCVTNSIRQQERGSGTPFTKAILMHGTEMPRIVTTAVIGKGTSKQNNKKHPLTRRVFLGNELASKMMRSYHFSRDCQASQGCFLTSWRLDQRWFRLQACSLRVRCSAWRTRR